MIEPQEHYAKRKNPGTEGITWFHLNDITQSFLKKQKRILPNTFYEANYHFDTKTR